MTQEQKQQFAKWVLQYIICDDTDHTCEKDNENKYYQYAGGIVYLVDFTRKSRDKDESITDWIIDQAQDNCEFITEIKEDTTKAQFIRLFVNGEKVEIYVDDNFIYCEYLGENV